MSLASDVRKHFRVHSITWIPFGIFWWEQVMTKCRVQNWEPLLKYFLNYLPFDAFYAYWCPHCNLNTLWNIIMILHSYVEQVMTICRIQEW